MKKKKKQKTTSTLNNLKKQAKNAKPNDLHGFNAHGDSQYVKTSLRVAYALAGCYTCRQVLRLCKSEFRWFLYLLKLIKDMHKINQFQVAREYIYVKRKG